MNDRAPRPPVPWSPASALVVLGAVLLADALDAIDLSFAAFAPLALLPGRRRSCSPPGSRAATDGPRRLA